MKTEGTQTFYSKLHSADQSYSAGEYRLSSLLSLKPVKRWYQSKSDSTIRFLDVGCGKGLFLRDLIYASKSAWGYKDFQATGIDIVQSPGNHFLEISPDFIFKEQNLDGVPLPFANQSFDFISCNHVLEHIFETEMLLREFHRVLARDGLCVISVPNLSAWINRIGFLFASQPLGSELGSEEITYGFWPTFLQKKLSKFKPSGHIRDFTPRGLKDLASHCGFKTMGWWAQSHGLIARLGKWAGRGIGIVLTPK